MYIGISGKPGSGKDTLASYFVNYCKRFTRVSLGDRIREIAIATTGLTMEQLRNHPEKDAPLPQFNDMSGRELTIEIGKGIETTVGYDVWCKMTDKIIQREGLVNVVVPDIRTEIQANWILENNGFLIRIDNDEGPHKYDIENQLDHWKQWDIKLTTADIFAGPKHSLVPVVESIYHDKLTKIDIIQLPE